jgi:UrcA family protein
MNGRKMACLAAAGFIGTLLVGAAIAPAHGQSLGRPVTVEAQNPLKRVVSFGDLALNTKQDRKVLVHRVGRAVQEVCPTTDEDGSYYDVQACDDFAWSGAWPQIRRAFDRARSGSTLAMSIEISAGAAK